MKKFILFLILLICICLNFPNFKICNAKDKIDNEILFYTSNQNIQNENVPVKKLLNVHNKLLFEAKIDKSNFEDFKNKYHTDGFTVKISDSNIDVYKLLKNENVKIIDTQQLENKFIIYGYTSKFNGYTLCDNKKINLQIVLVDKAIIIGYPLILGSY